MITGTEPTLRPTAPDSGEPSARGGWPVVLISNPNSGRNRKHLRAIERIVANHPRVHHCPTSGPADVPAALSTLAERSEAVLAINGGDGTVARVLTHLLEYAPFERLPLIALLPGGTTNMNAGDVGLRGGLVSAVQRLCRWADDDRIEGRLLRRAILRVDPGAGLPVTYGMFFGTGAIIHGIEYCRARIHTKGLASEIGPGLAMVRTMWGIAWGDRRFARPVAVSVTFDNAPPAPAEDILILLVSSLERLFLGMRPYWGNEAGPLHVSMIRAGADRLLRNLPALLRGKPGRHAGVAAGYQSRNVGRISLTLDGPYTLDGELYQASRTAGPVSISVGGPVTFIRL
jgi:diacylglycerol kinase (ATP)